MCTRAAADDDDVIIQAIHCLSARPPHGRPGARQIDYNAQLKCERVRVRVHRFRRVRCVMVLYYIL